MKITPIKTPKVKIDCDILDVIESSLPKIKDNSIISVTSKIVSICEGSIVPLDTIEKKDLVYREADLYLPKEKNKYGTILTIKNDIMIPTSGIDESNGDGFYILWPKDAYESANKIRKYFKEKYNLKNFGVIITDSKTTPLRLGTTGIAIGYSGFKPLNNYIGKRDIFGKKMKITKANIMDGLAVASVLVMGEGSEQTPLALIEEVPFVTFSDKNPSKKEINSLRIKLENDLYGELLTSVDWETQK